MELKVRIAAHHVKLAFQRTGLRVVASVFAIGLIWLALFLLFSDLFEFLYRGPNRLIGFVILGYTFNYFFAALTAMLVMSNAILLYGMLFRSEETAFLLSSPIRREHVFTVKFIETLVLSSWAFVLLGIPIMAAYGMTHDISPFFYVHFSVLFLFFLPIPAAIGALLTVGFARLFGARADRAGILVFVLVAMIAIAYGYRAFQGALIGVQLSRPWLERVIGGLDIVRQPLLPNDWISRSILGVIGRDWNEAFFYLWLTFINGLFLMLLAVRLGAKGLAGAYDYSFSHKRPKRRRRSTWPAIVEKLLYPLSPKLRLIIVKDLQGFVRDPLQWSQFLIFFGLLIIYILNLPNMRFGPNLPMWNQTISFLNLTAVSLILSTFTGRFIFPMVSLEGRRIWLLGMLPLERKTLVYAKFAFAAFLTCASGVGVIALSDAMLELPPAVRLIHISMAMVISCGLAGISVGLGARMPNFTQPNPSQIASGIGGTINLIISLIYIAVCLTLFGILDFSPAVYSFMLAPWSATLVVLTASGILGVGLIATLLPLRMGIRHFANLEF
jgi:ABC-2 type transport system permease protein